MTHEFDRAQVVHNDLGNWLCLHIKNAPRLIPLRSRRSTTSVPGGQMPMLGK
jgi:hypothetical protein